QDPHPSTGVSGRTAREPQSAIQPPSQQGTTTSVIGSPSSAGHQFQGLNVNGRSLTPLQQQQQQQQQLMLLKTANNQQAGLIDQLQTSSSSSFDRNHQTRAGLFQNQMPPMSGMQGHARQSSRFSFANDSNVKNASNPRLLGPQPPVMQTSSP